jgi:AbrB family looped-hinge helix DNA binding protein
MMTSNSTEAHYKMKVFPKGQVVIPIAYRNKYNIEIGDQIEVISMPEGILLKPIEKIRNPARITDRLFGIFSKYAHRKPDMGKADITQATQKGFTKRWAP